MKPKTFKFIRSRLDEAIELRDSFNFIESFALHEAMYRGEEGEEYIKNLFYTIFTSIIASTYLRNPKIIITSDSSRDAIRAKIIQKVHNRWVNNRKSGVKKTMRRITLDILLSGIGVLQVGSGGEFGRDPDVVIQSLQDNFEGMFDFEPERTGDELHSVSDENIWMKRIHPTMILMPYENIGPDIESMAFIAKRYYRRLSHVRKDRRYTGVKKLDVPLVRFGESNKSASTRNNTGMAGEADFVELIDYFCSDTGLIYTIIDGVDKIIKKEDMISSSLPFSIFNWTEDSTFPYPQPDAAVLYDKQIDLNEVIDQERSFRKTHKMMIFVDENKINSREVEEMQDASNPRGIIYINGKPSDAVLFGKYAISNDIAFSKRTIEDDARSELGFSKNSAGESLGGRTSAAEARIIGGGSQLRNEERRDILLDGMQNAFEISDEFRAEFWKTQRSITVAGETEEVSYNGDILYSAEGELTYNATMHDKRQESSETQRVFMLQAYDRLLQLGVPKDKLIDIMQETFPEISTLLDLQGLSDSLSNVPVAQEQQAQQQGEQ